MKSYDGQPSGELRRHFESAQAERLPQEQDKLRIAVVVLCAGKGERMGLPYNKLLYHIGEKTVLEKTLDACLAYEKIDDVLCVASPTDFDDVAEFCLTRGASVCVGGETRTESVRRALAKLKNPDIVIIHDGARPFATRRILEDAVASAVAFGSGIVAVPSVDAVKVVRDGTIVETLPKTELYRVQTPQAFRFGEITNAYTRIAGDYADDSEVYQLAGYTPHIVRGEYVNRKITTMSDVFHLADCYRVGFGYDVHALVPDRDLILGGVYIPFEKGLLGHSDADVLVHAIMDALLSAAGLPDIGVLFPDTDDTYKDISSMVLLERVRKMLDEHHATIIGISAVVMAERPKLAKLIPTMIQALTRTLNVDPSCINLSATTTEKLGIVGDGAGIASAACALIGL